jgi:Domain of unknown function (DUF222)
VSVGSGSIEYVFEVVSDVELIDVMGEASRDESTAIAQRLLAVGELYARRAVELSETFWWRTDPTEEVAAEISAAQNISRARAVGQIHYGRTLRERLPKVAKVFATGVIDFRLVATVIARTENVADEVMPAVDGAIARHVEKWMKLSVPKLRDRVDVWVAKFDPAGVRVPPKIDDSRYVEIVPTEVVMAGVFGNIHAADGAALDQRLDALAATVCDNDPRTLDQLRSDALAVLGVADRLDCGCGTEDCPAAAEGLSSVLCK